MTRVIAIMMFQFTMRKIAGAVLVALAAGSFSLQAQSADNTEIKNLIQAFKKDERGPYQAIRWFCPDGTILPPNERCQEPGGIQHALHKEAAKKLAREQGIYLGQILAGTPFEEFFDAANQNSRLKQYQLENYLQGIDDGWIMRRARYYRGAIQAEDEEAWGIKFLGWALAQDRLLAAQFFLLRQAAKDIPHRAPDNRWQTIRAVSKTISDSLPAFTDIRVKIHGQPESSDLQRVRVFHNRYSGKISTAIDEMFQKLIQEMALAFQSTSVQSLQSYAAKLPNGTASGMQLNKILQSYGNERSGRDGALSGSKCRDFAELLWTLRQEMPGLKSTKARLAALDLSIEVESLLFQEAGKWKPQSIGDLMAKGAVLCYAAAGCGFLESWEWQQLALSPQLFEPATVMPVRDFLEKSDFVRRAADWGAGMVRSEYEAVVSRFVGFELLTAGFVDDRVRGSVLLPLGEVAGQITDAASRYAGISNKVLGLANQNQFRGLNPGFALGELQVITGAPEEVEFLPDKIYAVLRAPSDLKPVAGIATVTEGNLVSHVQLLARNLGIPNATLSEQNLHELLPYAGRRVFYAVSPRGAVVLKLATEMNAQERALVETQKRSEDKIRVPVDRIKLRRNEILPMSKLRAADSGVLCGPKAANLGQLKSLFPDKVGEGLVIPFGIFRLHMDQTIPGSSQSYWQSLQGVFETAATQRRAGASEEEVETLTLQSLTRLREAIQQMPLLPAFREELRLKFRDNLGGELGRLPAFIRSDTNMEDLKDFTGAGLNLTVFNVVEEAKILQGIRDVWASPYTERSYRWRQKYLLNPENVYPSILILPTVNVDKSGVMITSGISTGEARDVTVAFNRGAGGAVEGQRAESYLLRHDGRTLLLSPARETKYTVLPTTGGTGKGQAFLHQPVLSVQDLEALRALAIEMKRKLPGTPGISSDGPFDIELGFKDDAIWLFQVRPYVENRRAQSSDYLQSLDPKMPANTNVRLNEAIVR